jgi:3-oxoacyl-[acyl-carrier protein] reductase
VRLLGKVAVVTGAAQGIGRVIALGLGREGAKVVVADLQSEKARSVANELIHLGAEALPVEVDVANESSVQQLAQQTFNRFGRVDILVNDAGVYLKALVVDISEENWDRTIDVNLGGNFLCSRAFVPSMRAQKGGRIISIASGIAHYGGRIGSPRADGVDGDPVGRQRICSLRGFQGRHHRLRQSPGARTRPMPRTHRTEEELMARLRSNPLGHVLEPEDFVGPVLFLASEAASYITGQAINVNCGSYMT